MRGLFGALASGAGFKTTDISNYTYEVLFGGSAKSGVAVNLDSSLRVSTVLACARVLSESVAQTSPELYRLMADGQRDPVIDHPAYTVLARRPNEWMSPFELREMLTFHAVLTGNGYAYIGRGGGKVQEIIPLVPSRVVVEQSLDYGLLYRVTDLAGNVTALPRASVFHLRGPSWNGYLGMDAVHLAREAIGLAIAAEETHARLHGNGARPGGILSVEGRLEKPQRDRLKEAWQEHYSGVGNAFKTAVLDSGAKWTPMAMTGVDSQHLETRRFQLEEICRAMRVFPQMVMHSDKTSTFASAESFFQAHITYSAMPWIRRFEEAFGRDVIPGEDNLIVRLNVAEMLRGDESSQASFFEKALGGSRGETAWMTRNEVRRIRWLPPIEGGDKLPIPPPPPVAPPGLGGAEAPKAASLLDVETKIADAIRALPAPVVNVTLPDAPVVNVTLPAPPEEKSVDYGAIAASFAEAVRAQPAPNVNVHIAMPKQAGKQVTRVTKVDAEGRIEELERIAVDEQ